MEEYVEAKHEAHENGLPVLTLEEREAEERETARWVAK